MKFDEDILMSYILGELSPEEMRRIEEARIANPELNKEIEALELSLEEMAFENKIKAPNLKPTIEQIINKENTNSTKPIKLFTYLGFAASFLIGALLIGFYQQQKINTQSEQLASLENNLEALTLKNKACETSLSFFDHVETKTYLLEGKSDAKVTVYWNESLKEAKLKTDSLPQIQADETYQIWADVDGVMMDLGTFDYLASAENVIDLNYLDRAESLNITIEPLGGSKTPTVSRLVANKYI